MSRSDGGRVLVVDDDPAIRVLIRVNLELEGFRVATACDGAECLELVEHVRPEVITLDSVMPRLDGPRTAQRLRADPRTRGIRIALVSADPEAPGHGPAGPATAGHGPAGHGPAEASGLVDGVLVKPFNPAALVRLVRELAARPPRSGGRTPATPPGARPAPGGRYVVPVTPGAAAPMPGSGVFSHTLAP